MVEHGLKGFGNLGRPQSVQLDADGHPIPVAR